jgi:hypothetical protein
MYEKNPVLLTMIRNDGTRCCCKCPCKWLDTCVLFPCCQDGMHVYAGPIADEKEKGRPPSQRPDNQLLGSVTQPIYGGCCIPTLHLRADGQSDTDQPFAKVEGPCFFGGWSEMCCSFKFYTSFFNSPTKAGDAALIIKKRPASLTGAAIELFTNSDVYSIQFSGNLTPGQKTTVLTAQLLADYMFFDGNTEKCKYENDTIYCYFCYCSILGWLVPCEIAIPTKAG